MPTISRFGVYFLLYFVILLLRWIVCTIYRHVVVARKIIINNKKTELVKIVKLEERAEMLKHCCIALDKATRQQSFNIVNNLLSEVNGGIDAHTIAVYINRYTERNYDKTVAVFNDIIAFRDLNGHLLEA